MSADGTQVIKLGIVAISDDITLVDELRRVWLDFLGNPVFQRLTEIELLPYSLQGIILGMLTSHFDWLDGFQGMLQLHDLARRDPAYGNLGDDALQVSDAVQLVIQQLAELWLLEEVFHDIEALVDGANFLQREYKPTPEHTAAHSCHRTVDHIQERRTVLLHWSHQLETSDGKPVHAHKLVFLNAGKSRDMIDLRMLRYL